MRTAAFISLMTITTALSTPSALAQEQPKWRGHVEAEGKWGTERSLGEIGVFLPVWQNDKTLIFGDVRGRFDNNSSSEGNFGVGVRHQINDLWALGGYVFYDRRHTEANNNFNQATIGVEALSEKLELRVNGYIPESDEKTVAGSGGGSTTTAAANNGNFQFVTVTGGGVVERALPGVDIEAGYQFNLPSDWELWAYGGGFHFNADDYNSITGPRGRVELSYNNVPYLGDGSKFTLGFETQTDTVRGGQSWGIARLRIPLNYNDAKTTSELSALDKRMTTRIVRDIDIVAGESETPATTTTENASATLANGQSYNGYILVENGDNIGNEITAGGAGSLVVLDGNFNTGSLLIVNANQTIMGGGGTVTITGNDSGQTASVTLPGSRSSVHGTNGAANVFAMTNNTIIENIDITGGSRGINISTGNDQIVRNVTISDSGNDNMQIFAADNVTIDNVTMNNPDGGNEEGIQIQSGVDNLTIRNSTVNGANIGFIFVSGDNYNNITFDNVTVDNSGNVIEAQNNTTVDQISGDITVNAGGTGCLESGTGQFTNATLTVNGVNCP